MIVKAEGSLERLLYSYHDSQLVNSSSQTLPVDSSYQFTFSNPHPYPSYTSASTRVQSPSLDSSQHLYFKGNRRQSFGYIRIDTHQTTVFDLPRSNCWDWFESTPSSPSKYYPPDGEDFHQHLRTPQLVSAHTHADGGVQVVPILQRWKRIG